MSKKKGGSIDLAFSMRQMLSTKKIYFFTFLQNQPQSAWRRETACVSKLFTPYSSKSDYELPQTRFQLPIFEIATAH